MMGGQSDSAIIKPISKADIHKICSGQVILDLCSAVKELVENSLDAGATSIEVKLKEYGEESFEVTDNGCGISPENYQSVTLKYHTSKISAFMDLQSLSSFGFRGEALSSLCSLGDVTIETRSKHEAVGVQLKYDHSGIISSQKAIARQIGTTVTVSNLFSLLPVRHKEFVRSIKREYGRLISLLQAYAVIAKGVKFLCTNVVGRGAKYVVLQTQRSVSIKDNIVTVFGTKTLACLDAIDVPLMEGCHVQGFISKPGSGSGRASGDRQFFYINGRPVDYSKIAKILNEIYKSYNSQQYPIAILNFILPTSSYDVNVTPDKRKVYLHNEGPLLSALRESFEKLYSPNKYTYAVNNLENETQVRASGLLSSQFTESEQSHVQQLEAHESSDMNKNVCDEDLQANIAPDLGGNISSFQKLLQESANDSMVGQTEDASRSKSNSSSINGAKLQDRNLPPENTSSIEDERLETDSDQQPNPIKEALNKSTPAKFVQLRFAGFVNPGKRFREEKSLLTEEPVMKKWMYSTKEVLKGPRTNECLPKSEYCGAKKAVSACSTNPCGSEKGFEDLQNTGKFSPLEPGPHQVILDKKDTRIKAENNGLVCMKASPGSLKMQKLDSSGNADQTVDLESTMLKETDLPSPVTRDQSFDNIVDSSNLAIHSSPEDIDKMDSRLELMDTFAGTRASEVTTWTDNDSAIHPDNAMCSTQFNITRCRMLRSRGILGCLHSKCAQGNRRKKKQYSAATLDIASHFEGEKEKEAFLVAATKELERSFNKEDFKKMKVIGQFNLGFIIAKIEDDLFIIDQHASDEKYNFERLSETTILNSQPLLRSLPMQLSIAEELIISENMDTFRRNGFNFLEDSTASPGQRFQLSAVPYSKNIVFGIEDVQELISLLLDQPARTATSSSSTQFSPSSAGLYKNAVSQTVSGVCPSRVRTMLASRACRSSIMIGDPLDTRSMETILQHLSALKSPWNCPHGRPTMRHLIDLSNISKP